MPQTLIHIVDGTWMTEVANTDVRYKFVGDTLSEQSLNVQLFGIALRDEDAPPFNKFIDTTDENDIVLDQLFSTTDQLIINGNLEFSAVGADVLMDDLEEVGQIICEALMAVREPTAGERQTNETLE